MKLFAACVLTSVAVSALSASVSSASEKTVGFAAVLTTDDVLHGHGLAVRPVKLSTGMPRHDDAVSSLMPKPGRFPKIIDPGEGSPLDFTSGDTLSIEAWIRLDARPSSSFPYIVGKGRTHTIAGKKNDTNQNYALRLTGNGKTHLSFLWMDALKQNAQRPHRWTSKNDVPVDGRWHHVAVTYTFGTGADAVGYIDGHRTHGTWDMEGNSDAPPVNDDDDLWIGGSYGTNHVFPGLIDGLVIYRGALPTQFIKERTAWVDTQRPRLPWPSPGIPLEQGKTHVVISDLPMRSWFAQSTYSEPLFESNGFALTRLPNRYHKRGVIDARPGASMVRLVTTATFPQGQCRLLLRSLDAARVYLDDTLIAEQKTAKKLSGSAHGKVYQLQAAPSGVVQQTGAHTDTVVVFESDGKPHRFEAYRLLGGDGRVHQLGEFLVAVAPPGKGFTVLGADWMPDDRQWQTVLDHENAVVQEWNCSARNALDEAEDTYWENRHRVAAKYADTLSPLAVGSDDLSSGTVIDRLIQSHFESDGDTLMPLMHDDAFLRRVALDTTGRIPTMEELDHFGRVSLPQEILDRDAVIDAFLQSDEWADHWTPYWMDVLAENPALTKPKLNNTGPFRWYIHDALIDNWGMDRFVTNLILMEGSQYLGGPAGFGMASENDVPMAAKAHVIGTAFLGVEMKCARCHDAPNHPFQQSDLFSIAAMLDRKPLTVPASSSIPATEEELEEMIVDVSLKPGESIEPHWPFQEFARINETLEDSRVQLARVITAPENIRFREVLVNRLWQRLIGIGLMPDTSDWTDSTASHPVLLEYLARELLASGDNMKHVAGMIMKSQIYQRQPMQHVGPDDYGIPLRGPLRRRMTAEQLMDSLHTATGKPMRGEVQSFSQDGAQGPSTFFEMGRPSRAWQLVCTSNGRDRNSLRIPEVDMLNELMQAFGWRPQRQDPQDRHDVPPTPLRPLLLANGSAASRLLDATADAWLTQAAKKADSPEDFVHLLMLSTLSRRASTEEVHRLVPHIEEGFASRLTGQQDHMQPVYRRRVSWRNHFDPLADKLVLERIDVLREGDPPTRSLTTDWRERAEDIQWSLVNSPEFTWVP